MTPPRAIRLAFAAGTVLCATLSAQQPTFRTALDLVTVDVQVLTKDGNPVAGLTAEEFTVLVDGKPRPLARVEFLRYADVPAAGAAAGSAVPAEAPDPGYASNLESPPGRLIVLVVDQANITRGGGRGAMEAARRFLDRLTPADQVALATIPVGPGVDFTANRARVKEALGNIVGGGANAYLPPGDRTVSLAEAFSFVTGSDRQLWRQAVYEECETTMRRQGDLANCIAQLEGLARNKVAAAKFAAQNSLQALRALIVRLGTLEGPKQVVLVGQGLVTGTAFGDLDLLADVRDVAAATAASRVTLSVLQIDRAFLEAFDVRERWMTRTLTQDVRLLSDGLGEVAGAAGGPFFRLTVSLDPAFERVARETSAAYELAFEVAPGDRDGKAHSIEVKTSRRDVMVRARRSFAVGASTAVEAAAIPAEMEQRLGRLLGSPVRAVAVPIKVRAHALGPLDGAAGVRLLIAADLAVAGDAAGADVTVGYLLRTEKGGTVRPAIWRGRLPAGAPGTLYYTTVDSVAPGDYTLRVAAIDAAGRAGAVEMPFAARFDAAGGLEISDLLVDEPGVRAGGRMKVNVDGRLLGREIGVYVEVRRTAGGAEGSTTNVPLPTVRFDVSRSGDPAVLLGRQVPIVAEQVEGRYYAETVLDLASLEAGAYVLRATVLDASAQPLGRMARTLRVASAPTTP